MSSNAIHEWKLERFLLGELPDKEIQSILLRLENDESLRETVDRLRQSDQEILHLYPAKEIVPQIKREIENRFAIQESPSKTRTRIFRIVCIPAAAGIIIAVSLFLFQPSPTPIIRFPVDSDFTGNRIKGNTGVDVHVPMLHVFRKIDGDVEKLNDGARARQRDLLQLAYTAGRSNYGVIFSIDGKGVVTLHFPENIKQSTMLQQKKLIFLKKSYELDDAPDFERFFFVSSTDKLDAGEILKEANTLASKPGLAKSYRLPVHQQQTTILILKGEFI